VEVLEQRSKEAQRAAVSEVMPDKGLVLRLASGKVLVYDETPGKATGLKLRALVMPDGETHVFPTQRFRRGASGLGRRVGDPHLSTA
jgi:hypothetical protein